MSGHNKWTQIKHQKSATDKKRSVLFSKILNAITVVVRVESYTPAPNTKLGEGASPRLRSLIEKARANNIPQENIDRAIKRMVEAKNLEEIIIEAYGPDGAAIIIECITDNRNRTISEIKHLLNENGGKMAEQGSVRWAFDGDKPKFPQKISDTDKEKINRLIEILEEREDVQKIITNII